MSIQDLFPITTIDHVHNTKKYTMIVNLGNVPFGVFLTLVALFLVYYLFSEGKYHLSAGKTFGLFFLTVVAWMLIGYWV